MQQNPRHPSMGQAPRTLDPPIPIMQPHGIICQTSMYKKIPISFKLLPLILLCRLSVKNCKFPSSSELFFSDFKKISGVPLLFKLTYLYHPIMSFFKKHFLLQQSNVIENQFKSNKVLREEIKVDGMAYIAPNFETGDCS